MVVVGWLGLLDRFFDLACVLVTVCTRPSSGRWSGFVVDARPSRCLTHFSGLICSNGHLALEGLQVLVLPGC